MPSRNLILASQSPRRRAILEQIGIEFLATSVEVDESLDPSIPVGEAVQQVALRKAEAAAPNFPEDLILSADTIVVCNGRVFGKPADVEDAREILAFLQGETHYIYTGLALYDAKTQRHETHAAMTKIQFRQQNAEEIEAFMQAVDPLDKAGGYTVDGPGALLVRSMNGCFYNVLGLPVSSLYELFESMNLSILQFQKKTVRKSDKGQ